MPSETLGSRGGLARQAPLCLYAAVLLSALWLVHGAPSTQHELQEGGGEPPAHSADDDHESLWPLNSRDIWLLGGVVFTSFLAANAGIGGGGILLPMLVFVARFTPRLAAALSNVCILGGAVANLMLNIQRRHPIYGSLPLIDYDLILMMEPPTVLGALLGSFANKVLGTWITSSFMALVLMCVAHQLVRKALTPSTLKGFEKGRHPYPQRSASGPTHHHLAIMDRAECERAGGQQPRAEAEQQPRGGAEQQLRGGGVHGSEGGCSLGMNGGRRQHFWPAAHDSMSIPYPAQGHHHHHSHAGHHMPASRHERDRGGNHSPLSAGREHPMLTVRSSPFSETWMPLESISEASSVHHGAAYSTAPPSSLADEASQRSGGSGQGSRGGRSYELRGGHGLPRYRLMVEDRPGATIARARPHRKQQEHQEDDDPKKPLHEVVVDAAGYRLPYQLRIQEEHDDMLVEEALQDKMLEHRPAPPPEACHRLGRGSTPYGRDEDDEVVEAAAFRLPWGRLAWLGGLSVWVALSQLAVNSRWVECGSLAYWTTVLSVVPAAMFVLLRTRRRVLKENEISNLPPRARSLRRRPSVVAEELTAPLLDAAAQQPQQLQQQQQEQVQEQELQQQQQQLHPLAAKQPQQPQQHFPLDHGPPAPAAPNNAPAAVSLPAPALSSASSSSALPVLGVLCRPVHAEVQWTPKTTLLYPMLCSAAGVVAGVCGVGGGIIKGPLMLHLGVRPEVAVASSATMILATSLSATTVYAGLGSFHKTMDYAITMGVLGFLATALGQGVLQLYTKTKASSTVCREERQRRNSSIIIKIMAIIMVLSALSMGYAAILEVQKVVQDPSLLNKFGRICPSKVGGGAGVGNFASSTGIEEPGHEEVQPVFLTI